ncbi:hypothetical protein GYMLUDRAFT_253359, partial [Collybiopsis luxurians FD-317 M1]
FIHLSSCRKLFLAVNIKTYYGKSGLEIRKDLSQHFGTTHPSRKHPKGEAQERRKGHGEGNPPFKAPKTSKPATKQNHSTSPDRASLEASNTDSISSPSPSLGHDSDSYVPHDSHNASSTHHYPTQATAKADSDFSSDEEFHSCAALSDSEAAKGPDEAKKAQERIEMMSPSKLNPQLPEEDFRPIQLSVIKAIPSAKWNNNSCWLDSSMEVYFIAMAFHDCFRDFKSLTGSEEGQALPSLIFYLYKVFSFWLERGLFKLDNVSDITTIRDQFQQFLYNVKAVTGPVGSYQTAFGWLQNLLTPAHPFPTNSGCVEYFTACTLEVWMCHDPDSGMKHCRLKSYRKLLGWAPPGRDWDQHKGSIQRWFNSMAQVDKAIIGDSQPGCWRQERQDDTITSVCAGSSKQIQILTDIPVLLNIAPDVTAEKFWDFPLEIFIGPKAAAHKKGLVYDLVGVVLTNGNHYVTLTVIPTASKSKAIFAYDGMKNGGYSQYLPGAAAKLIAGQHPAGRPTWLHT